MAAHPAWLQRQQRLPELLNRWPACRPASLGEPLWGCMGDRSSRRVMVTASLAAGVTGLVTWLLHSTDIGIMNTPWSYALLFLLVTVFHSGVRRGAVACTPEPGMAGHTGLLPVKYTGGCRRLFSMQQVRDSYFLVQ